MRKAYVRVKLPEEITDYVAYVATNRILGFRSMIEFVANAVRKEIMRLRQLGFIPPTVPKVREIPAGAIGALAAVLSVAITAVTLLAFLQPGGVTGLGIWEETFSPLAGWNIAGMYDRYQGFINLTLYFVVFFALCFAGTKRWFDRREAIALAAVFAAALSIGLAIMPVNWLRQLSPLALLLVALGMLYAVFEGMKRFGFAWVSSGSLSYILAYLLVRTHRPDLFAAVGGFGSALHLIFFVAFAFALFTALSELWSRSESVFARAGHAARLAWGESFGSPAEKALLTQQQAEIGQLLKIQPEEYRVVGQLDRDLVRCEEAVRKYGYSRESLATIADELRKLRGQESDLARRLDALRTTSQRLRALDIELFTKLKKSYEKLNPRQQQALKKAMAEQVSELNLDTQLPQLAEAAQRVQAQADDALGNTITLLEKNLPHDALRALDRARYFTQQLQGLLRQVEEIEAAVAALQNRTMRFFKP